MSKYTDSDILSMDSVTIAVASDYLGVPPERLRVALQDVHCRFLCLPSDNGTANSKTMFILSPGALVRWKNGTLFAGGTSQ